MTRDRKQGMETMLPPDTASARLARGFAVDALHEFGLDEHADLVTLLVSELVTNSILHARTDVTLRVVRNGSVLRVEVADASPVQPLQHNFRTDAATGRGMRDRSRDDAGRGARECVGVRGPRGGQGRVVRAGGCVDE
jgi:anti-sigma regulatory factor (Ser/Thr protein kinase)